MGHRVRVELTKYESRLLIITRRQGAQFTKHNKADSGDQTQPSKNDRKDQLVH